MRQELGGSSVGKDLEFVPCEKSQLCGGPHVQLQHWGAELGRFLGSTGMWSWAGSWVALTSWPS